MDGRTYENILRVCGWPLISIIVTASCTPYSEEIGWPANRNVGVAGEILTFFNGFH